MKVILNASIVLYQTKPDELKRVIDCIFMSAKDISIYLIDNSPTDELKQYKDYDRRIIYSHNPGNPGFGAAHNIAIADSLKNNANYHLIVNPDIYFNSDVIESMIRYMENDSQVGMMMPEILNFDGTIQNLPKLIPNPISIIWRKIKKPKAAYQRFPGL